MNFLRRSLSSLVLLLPLAVYAASSPLEGRWRLDPARSSPLDGWSTWDLVITVENSRVAIGHEMLLREIPVHATNLVDTAQPTTVKDFFRVAQRHMAIYPVPRAETAIHAIWLDATRTLRVEAEMPVEGSQGRTTLRLFDEYRLLEGDRTLSLLELHGSRPRPLVYRFNKVTSKE